MQSWGIVCDPEAGCPTAVIGAWEEDSSTAGVDGDGADNNATNAGAAYVFVRDPGTETWSQQAYLKASSPDAFDGFGTAVAISGDIIAVGATHGFLPLMATEESRRAQVEVAEDGPGGLEVVGRATAVAASGPKLRRKWPPESE